MEAKTYTNEAVAHEEELTSLELSLVVPYFNPGAPFRSHVAAIIAELESTGIDFEVLAVSDGSTDGSEEAIDSMAPKRLRRIGLSHHQGKGQALRVGMREARGRYLGFIDADGDLPASLIGPFVDAIRRGSVDIVVGSKRHPDSVVHYPLTRRFYSWSYQQLTRLAFGLQVADTQTGLKVLSRPVIDEVLPLMVEKRFAFDLELLVLASRLGYSRIEELPVRVDQRFGSTVSFRAVLRILWDTCAIWWRLNVSHRYG